MREKLKVLWFCNVAFSENNSNATGTWLHTMATELIKYDSVQLFNITQGKVNIPTKDKFQPISQWLMPYETLKNGLPSKNTIFEIQKIIRDINPDIIHIWGTENYWGLLSVRGYIKGNIILEIQGMKFVIEKYFYSGLSIRDILKCFGLVEFIKPSISLIGLKYSYKKWGNFEKEILMFHKNISTQSAWVRAHIMDVNPNAQIYKTSILLRKEFIEADKWEANRCIPYQVFTSTSSIISYKGLHILLDAIAILKKRYSQIRLVIAGTVSSGFLQEGYTKWLKNKIKLLGINENVVWLGPLDAKNLVLQMHKANAFVIPSFIETYCIALDEALTVGVPTAASFAGAMPELAVHEKSALYFPPGDIDMCANAIEKLFIDIPFASELSSNSYRMKRIKHNTNIAQAQLATYKKIIDEQSFEIE